MRRIERIVLGLRYENSLKHPKQNLLTQYLQNRVGVKKNLAHSFPETFKTKNDTIRQTTLFPYKFYS